jgi:hypothetical protein
LVEPNGKSIERNCWTNEKNKEGEETKVMDWLKENAKNIILLLSLIGAIFALNDRYVSAKDFTREVARLEKQSVQTFEQFKTDYAIDRLHQRENALSDRMLDLRIQMKKNKDDVELKELYDKADKEREKVRDEIQKKTMIK